MRLLQTWKQVSRGWKRHIDSYTGPDNHWQRNFRVEIRLLWQAFYRRATAIVRNERDPHLAIQRAEMVALITDLCTTLETYSYSRALIGGVAFITLILTRPNANFRETLGQLYLRTPNPFKQERILLQSLLSAGILRHGLAPTPWHSSRTGPRHIPPGALEERHIDILPRLQVYRLPDGARLEGQLLRVGDTLLPILQEPALARTEAQHRGLDLLQILQALEEMGNPTANGSEDFPLLTYEVWELQQHHRTLISHLYVLLPILFLTHQQEPYRTEIGRVGRGLLVTLLCLRCSHESELPDWIHAEYFGHLWTSPVPGRSTTASLQAVDWADTLSIWIHPTGALSTKLGHRGEQERAEATLTDLQRQSLRYDDEESQRLGLTLLHLLKTKPHESQPLGDAWDGFMQVLASSGDLLTSLTYAVSHPLAEDLYDLSLRGVESVYGGFLKHLELEEPPVLTMITALISEGLLATVLDKTLLYCQEEGSQTSTKAAKLLLSLSLEAPTTNARIRTELSHAVLILRKGWSEQSHDLLVGWLHEALFKFPWILPTVKRANIIPLLLTRAGSAYYARPVTPLVLCQSLVAMMTLGHLCQDYSYCCDVFNAPHHSLLTIVDNARLQLNSWVYSHTTAKTTRIGNVAQSIQFACIDCLKSGQSLDQTTLMGCQYRRTWVGRSKQHGIGSFKPCWP